MIASYDSGLRHNRRSQLARHRCHHHYDRSGRSLRSTSITIRGHRSLCYTSYSGSRLPTVRRDIRMEQHSCISGGDTDHSISCSMYGDDVLGGLYKELRAYAPSDLETLLECRLRTSRIELRDPRHHLECSWGAAPSEYACKL